MDARRVACVILLPLAFTLGLSLLASRELSSQIPHDLNTSAWQHFAQDISNTMLATNTLTRVALLLTLHTMHVLLCMPLMHITKVLYGFWLGILLGWSVCCLWELMLFLLYLKTIHKEAYAPIFTYTRDARDTGTLFRENMLFAMSSLPLQASAALVQFGDVSVAEFMSANALVTVVLSMKNIVCGSVLATGPSADVMLLLAVLLSVSTVLPTISTLYVSSQTLFAALREHAGTAVAREPGACSDGSEDYGEGEALEPTKSP